MKLRKIFRFTLPRGTGIRNAAGGKVNGSMRLIKIKDLLDIERDGEVKRNSGAFYIVLLAKLISELGNEKTINRKTIERLDPIDFSFLVDFLHTVNHQVIKQIPLQCPECKHSFLGEYIKLGEA